jgi:hypothetical protein
VIIRNNGIEVKLILKSRVATGIAIMLTAIINVQNAKYFAAMITSNGIPKISNSSKIPLR